MRVSEACDLTVEGVDLDDGMALVRGKGSTVRRSTWVRGPSAPSTAVYAPPLYAAWFRLLRPSGYLLVTCARHAAEGQDRRRVASDCSRT